MFLAYLYKCYVGFPLFTIFFGFLFSNVCVKKVRNLGFKVLITQFYFGCRLDLVITDNYLQTELCSYAFNLARNVQVHLVSRLWLCHVFIKVSWCFLMFDIFLCCVLKWMILCYGDLVSNESWHLILTWYIFIGETVSIDLETTRGRIQSDNCWHNELPAGSFSTFSVLCLPFSWFLWFAFHVYLWRSLSAQEIARENFVQ